MKTVLDHTKAHQKYFEELTRIPHGSYHEDQVADFLVHFAQENHLAYKRDAMHNVLIYKPASVGYEQHEPVLLQAHTDMVCEKNQATDFDFEKEPLQIYIEEGMLKAKGTTLGADDGVGVAYMLALLADDTLSHPPLECVFTVQEEVGLFGAMAIKKEDIHAKRMINLDDGGENLTCMASAGGVNVILSKEALYAPVHGSGYRLNVTGLSGGHSGGEIHKEKGNANKLLARVLYEIMQHHGLQLQKIEGGLKDNAIPREAYALFVSEADKESLQKSVERLAAAICEEYAFSDEGLCITLEEAQVEKALASDDTQALLQLLRVLPDGMRHHSVHLEDLTTASSNLGVVRMEDTIYLNCSIRGAQESFVDDLAQEVEILASAFGFDAKQEARYPAWNFTKDSKLRQTMEQVCQEVLGKELQKISVHGGLECGVFKALEPEMDIVTMGPKMEDIHTPQERLDLESFDRTYSFLRAFITKL